jgi:predicted PurR-regulated permease PerM
LAITTNLAASVPVAGWVGRYSPVQRGSARARESSMSEREQEHISAPPSARARWIRADVVLLVIGIAALVWFVGGVLLMVFAGILIAIALDGLADLVSRYTPLARTWALALITFLLALLLTAGGWFIIPQFLEQFGALWEQLLLLLERAHDELDRFPWIQQALGLDAAEDGGEESGDIGEIANQVATAVMTVLGIVATVLIVVVIAVFMAANPALYRNGLLRLVPRRQRDRADELLATAGFALRWWLLGQLISMLVLGTVTSIGLLLLGVEVWLGLGVLVGLFTFVPFLGPILAGIPVVTIGFATGVETGLAVLVFYLVLQNVEGNVLTPMIQQRVISLPPALLISVQVLMGTIFGIGGLVLAAPVAVLGMIAVNLLYIEDVLGEPRANP